MKIMDVIPEGIEGLEKEGRVFKSSADGLCGYVMSFTGEEEVEEVLHGLKEGIRLMAPAAGCMEAARWHMRCVQGIYKGIRLAYEKALYADVFSEEEWDRLCALRGRHCFREIVRVTPESEYSEKAGVTSVEDFVGKVVKPDVWVIGNSIVEMSGPVWGEQEPCDGDCGGNGEGD